MDNITKQPNFWSDNDDLGTFLMNFILPCYVGGYFFTVSIRPAGTNSIETVGTVPT